MKIDIYQIDAFTDKVFGGNPAAVCPLEAWPPDETLLNIANENNLSETAFFVKENNHYHLRWFTPTDEVELCGHATLASAFVIFEFLEPSEKTVRFGSLSGELIVHRTDNGLQMDFPVWPHESIEITEDFVSALGARPLELFDGHDWMAVFETQNDIENLNPNMEALKAFSKRGVLCTAPGDGEIDFVSRCFFPSIGVPEDPVTGSAHCMMTPYWSDKLNKTSLSAHQISARGGKLLCELADDRIHITGNACLYMKGHIHV